MSRYVLVLESTVRVLDADRQEVGTPVRIECSVAIDSNYKNGVIEIIDSTTKEFGEDMATHAKRIFEESRAAQR